MKWLKHIFPKDLESFNYEHEDTALELYRKIEHIK